MQIACLRAFPEAGMVWTDLSAVDPGGRRVAERYLRRMYRTMREHNTSTLFTSRRAVGSAAPQSRPDLASADLFSGDVYRTMLLGSIVHTSTVLLRRERLVSAGRFDESLRPSGEDYDFHLRVCRSGTVAFVDVPTIHYRVGAADQLTAPGTMVPLAQNALRTVERALSEDEARADRRLARRARRRAHLWLGTELLEAGSRRAARHELIRAIRLGAGRRGWRRLAATFIPVPAEDAGQPADRSPSAVGVGVRADGP